VIGVGDGERGRREVGEEREEWTFCPKFLAKIIFWQGSSIFQARSNEPVLLA